MTASDPSRPGTGHDPGDDHEADHDHDHAHPPAPEFDASRYAGVEGWIIRAVSDCARDLLVVVPRERLDAVAESVARGIARKANLRGFRPGKAPVARIKTLFADDIRKQATEKLVQQVWEEASTKEDLRPVASPVLTEMWVRDGEPVRFAARFEVLPAVTLAGLASIAATPKTVRVGDGDIDSEIDSLRNARATLVDSESKDATPGDIAEIGLRRWAPGASRDAEPAEDRKGLLVEVANEKNLPGLDKALLGMAVGETRNFDAEIPDGQGGVAVAPFSVSLMAVKQRRLPALDDAFVASLGAGLETVDALRAEIRGRLVEARRAAARHEQESEVLEQLVAKNAVPMPPSLIEQETEARVRRGVESLVRRGVDLEGASIDWKSEFDKVRIAAEKDLRADWLLELVAREKGVEVTEADVHAEIEKIARERGARPESVRSDLEKNKQISNLRTSVRRRRTLDLLRSGATISVE